MEKLHLHASLLNDEGLVLSVHNSGAVLDNIRVHPVKFPGLYGPVVGVCKADGIMTLSQTSTLLEQG